MLIGENMLKIIPGRNHGKWSRIEIRVVKNVDAM